MPDLVPRLLSKQGIAAAVGAVNAVVVLAVGLAIVHWSVPQGALVVAEVNTGLWLALALVAHFRPATSPEPVQVAGSLTAFTTATLAVFVGFQILTLTDAQIGLILATETSIVAFVGAVFVRGKVAAIGPVAGTKPGPTPQPPA